MESRVGSILHEARSRREIEFADVEASTRIRVRFLRAIENEEWDVLPGEVYTRGFIRTYASFLGLDGERLAEDHRRSMEEASAGRGPESQLAPASTATGPPGGRRPRLRPGWMALAGLTIVVVAAILALPGGDEESGGGDVDKSPSSGAANAGTERKRAASESLTGVVMQLEAEAEIWVCLLDDVGKVLVNGQILEAGAEEGPFRSDSFTVSFGNGEVSMLIDGRQAEIPPTSSPIGYSIDSSGSLTELDEAERPTCL